MQTDLAKAQRTVKERKAFKPLASPRDKPLNSPRAQALAVARKAAASPRDKMIEKMECVKEKTPSKPIEAPKEKAQGGPTETNKIKERLRKELESDIWKWRA